MFHYKKFMIIILLIALLAACQGVSTQKETVQNVGQLYTFTSDVSGFDTNTYYYDTGQEVVVFDTQFTEDLAQQMIEDIQTHTNSPIRYVVITHPNPDKFNGVGPFRELGAKIVASKATAEAIPEVHAYKKYYFVNIAQIFTEETYPPEATVDITFDKNYVLTLQGEARVELQVLANTGVATTQTIAHISAIQALIVGDLIHHNTHAWLEGGIQDGQPQPNLRAWRSALDELLTYSETTIYGGRGEPVPLQTAVQMQQAYLHQVEGIVTGYIAGLGEQQTELLGEEATVHHQKIATLIAEAFPEYHLPYMTEFSIYGLVGSVVAQ